MLIDILSFSRLCDYFIFFFYLFGEGNIYLWGNGGLNYNVVFYVRLEYCEWTIFCGKYVRDNFCPSLGGRDVRTAGRVQTGLGLNGFGSKRVRVCHPLSQTQPRRLRVGSRVRTGPEDAFFFLYILASLTVVIIVFCECHITSHAFR